MRRCDDATSTGGGWAANNHVSESDAERRDLEHTEDAVGSDQVIIWDAMMNSTASPNVTSLPSDSSVMNTSNSSSIIIDS